MYGTESLSRFAQNNIESSRVFDLIPVQLRSNNTTFAEFLQDYYAFLNETDNPSNVISRIISEHDIDFIADPKYLSKVSFEIAQGVPESPYVQKAFLLKRIIDYYNIRGSKESVQFFFQVFFNESAEVSYPWDRVLFTSDGNWTFFRKMRVIPLCGSPDDLRGKTLIQRNLRDNIISQVDVLEVEEKFLSGRTYFELTFSSDAVFGEFGFDFEIETLDRNFRGKVFRTLTDIKLVNRGSNYLPNDSLLLDQKENITFLAFVSKVGAQGEILGVNIDSYGNSSELHYIENPELSEELEGKRIFINGELLEGQINGITIVDGTNDNIDFSVYENSFVDVSGIYNYTNNTLTIDSIFLDENNVILHDFEYYNKPNQFDIEDIFVVSASTVFITIIDSTNILSEGDSIQLQNIADTGDLLSFLKTQTLQITNIVNQLDGRRTFEIADLNVSNFDDTSNFNLTGGPLVIGPIPDISFNNDLRTLSNVEVKTESGTGAEFGFQFGSFFTTDGFYTDQKGRTSSEIVIQDSFFYQTFSYLIQSTLSLEQWQASFEDLVHPSGFEFFNEINSESKIETGIETDFAITVEGYNPPSIDLTENIQSTTETTLLVQDYTNGAYFLDDYTGSAFAKSVDDSLTENFTEFEFVNDSTFEAPFVEPSPPTNNNNGGGLLA